MHKPLLILLACTVGAMLGTAQPPSKPLVIQHVRVFDGTRVLDNTSVLVEGSVIRSVGPNIVPPPGSDVIDGTGKTLLIPSRDRQEAVFSLFQHRL